MALWIAAQVVIVLRVILPLPRPWGGGRVPWRMFTGLPGEAVTIVAEGVTPDGARVAIPIDRWFRFTRGATEQRAYALSTFLLTPGHRAERAAFARWLADRMAEDGTPLREVTLIRRHRDLFEGTVRAVRLGRFEVGDGPG